MTLESILDFILSNIWFLIIIFWFLAPLFRGGKGRQTDQRRSGLPGQPGQPGRQSGRQPDRQFGQPEQPGQFGQPNRPGQFGRLDQPGPFERPPIQQQGQAGNWQENQTWEQQRQANSPQRQASQPRREKEFGWPGREVSNPLPFPKFPWEEEEWQWDRRGASQPAGHTPQKVENPTAPNVEEEYPPFVIITDDRRDKQRDIQFNTDREDRQEKRLENQRGNRLQTDNRGAKAKVAEQEQEQEQELTAVSRPTATDLLPSVSQAVQGMIWSQIFGPPKGLESRRFSRYNPYSRRR